MHSPPILNVAPHSSSNLVLGWWRLYTVDAEIRYATRICIPSPSYLAVAGIEDCEAQKQPFLVR